MIVESSRSPRRTHTGSAPRAARRRGAPSALDPVQPALQRPGAKTFERGHVGQIQRARLIAATAQVACEDGAANVTVGRIVERAGVSRRTFYEIFNDSSDCLFAALTDALEQAQVRVLSAWSTGESWRERMRAGLIELLKLFEEEPVTGQLLVVESLAAGRRVLEERSRVLDALIDAVHREAAEHKSAAAPARVSVEGAVGGVLGVLHARLAQPSPGGLIELTGALMGMLVLPYHGPAAARRELARPAPAMPSAGRQSMTPLRSDPFKEAGMRLTYRTMLVLSAIAQRPGSSNRQVGDLADMADPGQISKLLARLERLGLIVNKGHGQSRGAPNAWTLTPAGGQVVTRIDIHTDRSVGNLKTTRGGTQK